MKAYLTLVLVLVLGITSFAQGIGINYKAVIKDGSGNLVTGQTIDIQFDILKSNGTSIFSESHTVTTDTNGIIVLVIGDGTPSLGNFNDINWSSDLYQLQVEIDLDQDGTPELSEISGFNSVPYAKQADKAAVANNALIADQALIAQNVTGLEQITENDGTTDNTGWRLIESNPDNYGSIGDKAVDLSISLANSDIRGATGYLSTAMGSSTEASGDYSTAIGRFTRSSGGFSTAMGSSTEASGDRSTAMGSVTTASGQRSTAMGASTTASGDYSTAIGRGTSAWSFGLTAVGTYNNICLIECFPTNWHASSPAFVVGNGINDSNRSNALVVFKDGKITAPSLDIAEITNNKSLVTKEYADANYATNNNYLIAGGNIVSNNVGIGDTNPTSLFEVAHNDGTPDSGDQTNAFSIRHKTLNQSWQFYASGGGSLYIYEDGNFRGVFDGATGAYTQTSDRRAKKDISTLENNTLDRLMQLNPVSYLMKDQKDNKRTMGLISQEVQEVFPSVTHYVEEHDLLALSYTELIPVLIKAIQEQQQIIEQQRQQLNTQDSKIEQLENSLQALTQRMDSLEANNE